MKKILLSVFAVCAFVGVSNAQTSQGSKIVGGGLTFDFENVESESGGTTVGEFSSNTVTITPLFGYFVMDGLAVGLELDFTNSKFEDDDDGDEFKSTTLAVGPFVKYYHESGIFGMGSIGFGSIKSEDTDGASGQSFESTDNLFNWRIGAGYAAFLNESISIEPMISYGGRSLTEDDSDPEFKQIGNSFRFSVGFNIFLN